MQARRKLAARLHASLFLPACASLQIFRPANMIQYLQACCVSLFQACRELVSSSLLACRVPKMQMSLSVSQSKQRKYLFRSNNLQACKLATSLQASSQQACNKLACSLQACRMLDLKIYFLCFDWLTDKLICIFGTLQASNELETSSQGELETSSQIKLAASLHCKLAASLHQFP